ncbi:hypothetical protein [Amycolatopsis sp.]|uniref:hypothetical protein n=1 Tax=Amycolatopsis sp. TaxID=37632 RepID=UPI002B8D3B90|nr:hypothetical protein [Amycolatopsis sp.]HVV14625.1 hypothetical protein [Amycolatopsis sp.]
MRLPRPHGTTVAVPGSLVCGGTVVVVGSLVCGGTVVVAGNPVRYSETPPV